MLLGADAGGTLGAFRREGPGGITYPHSLLQLRYARIQQEHRWSPTGRGAVFRRDDVSGNSPSEVYLIDADGGGDLRPAWRRHVGSHYQLATDLWPAAQRLQKRGEVLQGRARVRRRRSLQAEIRRRRERSREVRQRQLGKVGLTTTKQRAGRGRPAYRFIPAGSPARSYTSSPRSSPSHERVCLGCPTPWFPCCPPRAARACSHGERNAHPVRRRDHRERQAGQ